MAECKKLQDQEHIGPNCSCTGTACALGLGELYLRGKVAAHTKETFHRTDPQTNYSAIKDVLRLLDEARQDV